MYNIFNIKLNKRGANFHVNITVRDNKAYLHAHNGCKKYCIPDPRRIKL